MLLMKLTSTVGILETVALQTASNLSNDDALTILNGDLNTDGSVANQMRLNNLYTDSLIANVDLSQVETNRTDLETINGGFQNGGTLITAVIGVTTDTNAYTTTSLVPASDANTANEDALTVLNSDSTVVGSVNHSISLVIGSAPEPLNTLRELSEELAAHDDVHDTINATIATNLSDSLAAIAAQRTIFDARVIAVEQTFVDNLASAYTTIEGSFDTKLINTDAKYLQIHNLFAEYAGNVSQQSECRDNIGAIGSTQVTDYITANAPVFKAENHTVAANIITLDTRVAAKHIDYIIINYPNSEYDTLPVVAGANPGEFVINDSAANDLDTSVVNVHYVLDQSL